MMFNYDWFHRGGLLRQVEEAKNRCAAKKYPDVDPLDDDPPSDYAAYRGELDARIILYLKDGLSYEMREMAEMDLSSALAFECVPVDENYTVGAYVIVVPFEDIARVEVFAVHPDEKPMETLRIPGFKAGGDSSR